MGSAEVTALQIADLHVRLAGRQILTDVNLEARPAELIGLLGPNGAGKTTLMRSILGLIPRTKGSIKAASVGYVPQRHEFAWDYPIDVRHTVLNGRAGLIGPLRRSRRADFAATAHALKRVNLQHLADRPIGQLSGGQRQRVLVARALAVEPTLLLLDEPFTGMDFPSIEALVEILQSLAADGMSILMVTHDLAQAVHVCDRLVLLNRRIIADGSPSELQNAEPWMETFDVQPDSPLLRGVGLSQ